MKSKNCDKKKELGHFSFTDPYEIKIMPKEQFCHKSYN
jgi:hypothetical protein